MKRVSSVALIGLLEVLISLPQSLDMTSRITNSSFNHTALVTREDFGFSTCCRYATSLSEALIHTYFVKEHQTIQWPLGHCQSRSRQESRRCKSVYHLLHASVGTDIMDVVISLYQDNRPLRAPSCLPSVQIPCCEFGPIRHLL